MYYCFSLLTPPLQPFAPRVATHFVLPRQNCKEDSAGIPVGCTDAKRAQNTSMAVSLLPSVGQLRLASLEIPDGGILSVLYRCMYLGFYEDSIQNQSTNSFGWYTQKKLTSNIGVVCFFLVHSWASPKIPNIATRGVYPRLSLSSPLSQAAPFWRRAGAQPARGVGARAVIHTPRMILHKRVNTAQGGGPRSFRGPFVPKSARSNAARLFERVERPPPHHRPQSDMEHLGEAGEP